jgi:hypothetical protein
MASRTGFKTDPGEAAGPIEIALFILYPLNFLWEMIDDSLKIRKLAVLFTKVQKSQDNENRFDEGS